MSQRSVHILDQFLHDLGTGKSPDLESAARSLHETDRGDMLPIMIRRHAIQARQSGREPVLEEYQFASEWLPLDRLQDLIKTNNADLKEEIETNLRSAWDTSQRTRDGVVEPPPNLLPIDSLSWMPPNKIGKFEIGSVLGRGSFGIVLEGTDTALNRRVAIKIPRDASRNHADFVAEARANAALSHPNIVPLLEFGTDADLGTPYLVFPFVEGGDLARMIETSMPLSPGVAVRYIIDVANAIQHAHSRDLYHRDLKPKNILIDASGRACVSDFGLSMHVAAQRKQRNEFAGTPAYMAPEQVRGESESLDGRSDVWALGVVLYEMLSKRRPFSGGTPEELRNAILNHAPRPLTQFARNVPPRLDELCRRCLKRSPEDRFASSGELATALQSWLTEYENASLPPESDGTAPPKANRFAASLWSFILAAISLTIVIGGIGYMIAAQPKELEHLAWENGSTVTFERYTPSLKRLHLTSDQLAVCKIGEGTSTGFQVEAGLKQVGRGAYGFVWGWHRSPTDPNVIICQSLFVNDHDEPNFFLEWEELHYNTQLRYVQNRRGIGATPPLTLLDRAGGSVQLTVSPGNPMEIRWKGRLLELRGEPAKNYRVTPESIVGPIGFAVENASAEMNGVLVHPLK